MNYHFTSKQDWFSHAVPHWTQLLKHLDGTPCRCLEIGSHEGRSAIWTAENLLSNPEATLECIDPWNDDKPWNHRGAEPRFDANVQNCPRGSQIFKFKARSRVALLAMLTAEGTVAQYDFIYIDGCHEGKSVIEDFVLTWPMLKPGGILIFDDYPWVHDRHYRCPKPAIDCILDLWAQDFSVLYKDYQVAVRKND